MCRIRISLIIGDGTIDKHGAPPTNYFCIPQLLWSVLLVLSFFKLKFEEYDVNSSAVYQPKFRKLKLFKDV